jgi:hypothetical protein
MTNPGYDDWKLSTPYDDEATIGTEEGEICGRYAEPDDDAPRGYKPKPCNGTMVYYALANCSCHLESQGPCQECMGNTLECTKCGETVE